MPCTLKNARQGQSRILRRIAVSQLTIRVAGLPFAGRLVADRGELEGTTLINSSTVSTYAFTYGTLPSTSRALLSNTSTLAIRRQFTDTWTRKKAANEESETYRLDATLTLQEFTKLMIYSVLDHNNQQRSNQYRKDEYMIADHLEPYPIDLWNWGVTTAVVTAQLDIETVRLNLLPQSEASVTQTGSTFNLNTHCEWLKVSNGSNVLARGFMEVPIATTLRTVTASTFASTMESEWRHVSLASR